MHMKDPTSQKLGVHSCHTTTYPLGSGYIWSLLRNVRSLHGIQENEINECLVFSSTRFHTENFERRKHNDCWHKPGLHWKISNLWVWGFSIFTTTTTFMSLKCPRHPCYNDHHKNLKLLKHHILRQHVFTKKILFFPQYKLDHVT